MGASEKVGGQPFEVDFDFLGSFDSLCGLRVCPNIERVGSSRG